MASLARGLCCIASQVVEEGYEFFAKRQLVTIFSAPNYCGEFENAGAMMSVDETLMCSFQVSRGTGEGVLHSGKPHTCCTVLSSKGVSWLSQLKCGK